MFCMVFNLLSGARDHPFDKTRQKPVGRRLHGWAKGPAGNPRGAGVERAGRFAANTARTGAGLRAGNRTGLGDCQSKGRCLNQTTGGERPKQTSSADLIRQCQARGEPSRDARIRSPRPHMPSAPSPELPRCLLSTAPRCTPIRTWHPASICADVGRRPAVRAEGRGPGPHQLRSA
jgi:hypothetical protein